MSILSLACKLTAANGLPSLVLPSSFTVPCLAEANHVLEESTFLQRVHSNRWGGLIFKGGLIFEGGPTFEGGEPPPYWSIIIHNYRRICTVALTTP